ncbi:MAG: MaoC/PaaZ C-terminal domain-containing protein [Burkholderiaceae bacterium]|nr:MaoC/PaaZ C-terminal domain-containing protein [Burkholderiaceae bacterium]MDO9091010.1 MaoC/PaaZ C-terminal domain-containing protein [Burkholderiaceae bacterium]
MSIDYDSLRALRFPRIERSYTIRDTMLYALGLGLGSDPVDPRQLEYVYEKNLKALPTMPVVLGYLGFWVADLPTGIDSKMVLAGEQRLTLHSAVPIEGTVVTEVRVVSVTDKGPGRGAVVTTEAVMRNKNSGELISTSEYMLFCRGDGGYSAAPGQRSDPGYSMGEPTPERTADRVIDIPTRPEMGLVYRLSADMNKLHADPETARAAGFERPILHGLATFGVAGRAILHNCCGDEPRRLRRIAARFSRPTYPGDTIRVEVWEREGGVQFRARALERELDVLTHGFADIGD